jgi:hypothetical protein
MDSLLECLVTGVRGPYCYVLSRSVLKTDATRGPQQAIFIHIGEPPGVRGPGLPSQVTG